LIEKLAIIGFLDNEEFRLYIESGVNPFHEMFNSRYEYIPIEDLLVIFFEKIAPYKQAIEDAIFRQIERIPEIQTRGRDEIESFKETNDRIDNKRHKNYDYVVDSFERHLSIVYSHCIIMKKIYEIIWERENKGIDQSTVKMDLYDFFQKQANLGNTHTFQELFAEANAELGLLKLPEEFMKYKETIYR
jgi:hypothetical protein